MICIINKSNVGNMQSKIQFGKELKKTYDENKKNYTTSKFLKCKY